jgi:uncharacterized protein with LGFP repeats
VGEKDFLVDRLCSRRALARLALVPLLVLVASVVLTSASLRPARAATFAQAVLDEAARQQGKPYQYGATGPDSFDCSGFTGYVYRQLGVYLPRTASDQYAALPKVAQADKQPSDLVFTYDSSGTIYHVGIYAGNNQMWAAPKTGDYVRLQTIWTSSYKVARVVPGEIPKHYAALGGKYGFLGAPTTAERATSDGSGAFTNYAAGSIYWKPATGAQSIHGAIRDTWARLGWDHSALGYPTTDEYGTPDGRGRYNHFETGSVYWTWQTGAHEVRGAIRGTWSALGWERGPLGYPTTDESGTPDGRGRYNHFQGGSVYWTAATGAWEVRGAIRSRWASMGWERSWLGYPVSHEYTTPAGARSDFEHGSIVWDATTGTTQTIPR